MQEGVPPYYNEYNILLFRLGTTVGDRTLVTQSEIRHLLSRLFQAGASQT